MSADLAYDSCCLKAVYYQWNFTANHWDNLQTCIGYTEDGISETLWMGTIKPKEGENFWGFLSGFVNFTFNFFS